MLNEKQIIKRRKDLSIEKRNIKRNLKKKRNTYKGVWSKVNGMARIVKIDIMITLLDEILKGNKVEYKPLKSIKEVKSILDEMKQIKPMVIHLLKTEPDTRDDDNLLCIRVWENQGVIPNMKMQTFKKRYIIKQYAMADSISRVRRSIQERHKSLRGKLYDKRRQAEQEFKNQYKLDF